MRVGEPVPVALLNAVPVRVVMLLRVAEAGPVEVAEGVRERSVTVAVLLTVARAELLLEGVDERVPEDVAVGKEERVAV